MTAPKIGVDDVVTLFLSDFPDRVSGTVASVYTDVIGETAAKVRLSDGTIVRRNVVCLNLWVRPVPWWSEGLAVAS